MTNISTNFSGAKLLSDDQFSSSYAIGSKQIQMQSFEHSESTEKSSTFSSSFIMSSSQTVVQEATEIEQYSTSDGRKPSLIPQGDVKIRQDLELIKVRVKGSETTNVSDDEYLSDVETAHKMTLSDVDVAHEVQLKKRFDQTEVSETVFTSQRVSHTEEVSARIEITEMIEGTIQDIASITGDWGMNV